MLHDSALRISGATAFIVNTGRRSTFGIKEVCESAFDDVEAFLLPTAFLSANAAIGGMDNGSFSLRKQVTD